jgi:Flp pilus assembly protein TadD
MLLGTLDMRAGRVADAIDEFKLALWCRETAGAHVALGTALFESGKRDLARIEAQRALAIEPNLESARALLARIGGTPATPVLPSGETHV